MCVIAIKQPGKTIENLNWFSKAINNNPDGSGLFYKGEIFKSLDKTETLSKVKEISKDKDFKKELFVFHSRLKTHGSCRTDNCHPFTKGRYICFHNGVMRLPSVLDKTDSELWFKYLWYPAYTARDTEGILVALQIVQDSRVLIIDKFKNEIILQTGEWVEHNGLSLSNKNTLYEFKYKYSTDRWIEDKWMEYDITRYKKKN